MKNTKYNSGITMIELIIYIAIMGIVMAIVVQLMSGSFAVFAQARAKQGLLSAGSSSIERITYNIRNAESFSGSNNTFDANPGSLSVIVNDVNNVTHTYTYAIVDSRLTEQIDNGTINYMTGPNQVVTNFTVQQITANSKSGAVITIEIADNRVSPASHAIFKTATLMRGTY